MCIGKAVEKLATNTRKMVGEWMGGRTSCENAVWYNFMMQKVREAKLKIQMKKLRKDLLEIAVELPLL